MIYANQARSAVLPLWIAILALVLFLPSVSVAGSASTNLSVSASVDANCTITSGALAFGSYDPIVAHHSTALDGTGSVTITCTQGAVTNVELGLGNQPSGTTRRMVNGTHFLTYEIYQDASRTVVWGTGANKLDTGTAPDDNPRSFTAFGRIPAGQNAAVGAYSDTVVATVNF